MKAKDVLGTALNLAGAGLLVWAIVREMRMPAEQRRWTGQLAGFVPYDLRPPSLGRFRERYWNPADPRLFTPTLFGVGWGLNLARLAGGQPDDIRASDA